MVEDTDITEDQLTVQDILDEANQSSYHTILEVWREVLKPAQEEQFKKITPQWANRICTAYREISFQDVPTFRDLYFDKIEELAKILDMEIAQDDECLNMISPEEDVAHNSSAYLNVLINWQKAFLQWELDWETTDADAATNLASISEVHRMFFDSNGITSLLDSIQFEITDADRDILAVALQELKDAQEGQ